jgi:type II secretory pathway pseudopilin PulG
VSLSEELITKNNMPNFLRTFNTSRSVRAFTLVETLVATFIITIVILGPLTVAVNSSTYAKQTRSVMIATYLAEESIELLRHQQDSIYLRCSQSSGTACSISLGENPRQAAWRIFKERLGANSQGDSCFSVENPAGCSYDFINLIGGEDSSFAKYASTRSECSTLSITSAALYVCAGVHGSGATPTIFARSVGVVSVPTFIGTDQQYNDDLRITTTVSFTKPNGYIRQIKVVDFIHAHA